MSQNHFHDVARARPQRHSNPDLTSPLSDRVGHHAVNPDSREHGGDPPEDPEQKYVEAQELRLLAQALFHRPEISRRSARIYFRDRPLYRFHQLERVARSSQEEVHAGSI